MSCATATIVNATLTCLSPSYPPPSIQAAIMIPQDKEAVVWRKEVKAFLDALKNKKICQEVKHIRDFMK